jgi:alkaline phosphatase D
MHASISPARWIIALVAAVLACGVGAVPSMGQSPSAASPSADSSPDAPATIDSGPMVGYGTHRVVQLWTRTTAPASVQVRYWPVTPDSVVAARPGVVPDADTTLTAPVAATTEGDLVARFTLHALEPGNTYRYEVLVDGSVVERPYPLRFQTQALWQWRADPPAFDVAVGSCAYVNQDVYDRPGEPYGGEYGIFETIAAMNPDLMLWTGDNTYLREVDWAAPATIADRYAHTRRLPEMQALLGSTHHYATWDDHDYGPNNSDRSYELKEVTLETFKRYWANPTYGHDGTPGVFGRFQWNDAEFFLLDDRYHRSPTRAPRTADKTMLGEAQMQWLIDGLTSSEATFKIVVNGGQMLTERSEFETFARFPAERERLLGAIEEREIDGVVFLSGDRHLTEMMKREREGTYPLYEITVSPLTAGTASSGGGENALRVDGTLVDSTRNFGMLSFTGPRRDRTLTVRVYTPTGTLLWTRSINATALRTED